MTQYLVAIHHPDDYDPSVAEERSDVPRHRPALNEEMKVAGASRISSVACTRLAALRSLRVAANW